MKTETNISTRQEVDSTGVCPKVMRHFQLQAHRCSACSGLQRVDQLYCNLQLRWFAGRFVDDLGGVNSRS